MAQSNQKIICLGFHKTGTTSLSAVMDDLGYLVSSKRIAAEELSDEIAYRHIDKIMPQYDFFHNFPFPLCYKYLEQHYPDAKFILTSRDPDSWLKSAVSYYGGAERGSFKWVYGVSVVEGNEARMKEVYTRHLEDVRRHFTGNSKFIEVPMEAFLKPMSQALADFVGHPEAAGRPFPHKNQGGTLRGIFQNFVGNTYSKVVKLLHGRKHDSKNLSKL